MMVLDKNGIAVKTNISPINCKDFHTSLVDKKEYFQLMSGNLPVLSLKVSIGISEGEIEDTSKMDLKSHHGIYVPPEDFTAYECLPVE